jgi:lysozyme family protein
VPLKLGVDFNCNASICYGIGATSDALFRRLQQTLNAYGAGLVVDGRIGANTVSAVQRISRERALPWTSASREVIAANADAIVAQLASLALPPAEPPPEIMSVVQQAVTACRQDRSSPTCTNAKALCKTVRGTPNAQLPGVGELCAAVRLPLWMRWTIGALAVFGIATGSVIAYRHYRRAKTRL